MVGRLIPGENGRLQVVIPLVGVISVGTGGMELPTDVQAGVDVLGNLGAYDLVVKEETDIVQLGKRCPGAIVLDGIRPIEVSFKAVKAGLKSDGFVGDEEEVARGQPIAAEVDAGVEGLVLRIVILKVLVQRVDLVGE